MDTSTLLNDLNVAISINSFFDLHPWTWQRRNLWPILQPSTRGRSKCCGVPFHEQSCRPSLYKVYAIHLHWERHLLLCIKPHWNVLCSRRSQKALLPAQTWTCPHWKKSRRSIWGGRKSASRSTRREWLGIKTQRASGEGHGTWTRLRACETSKHSLFPRHFDLSQLW